MAASAEPDPTGLRQLANDMNPPVKPTATEARLFAEGKDARVRGLPRGFWRGRGEIGWHAAIIERGWDYADRVLS